MRGAGASLPVKIAVTGATGFVGRHVLKALAAREGISVTATARSPVPPDFLPPAFDYMPMDIAVADAEAYQKLGSPDVLIHLAWDGLPNYRSDHHVDDELPKQYAFIKALVDAGLPSLLVSGTCYEYGMQSGALTEDMTGEPSNVYAQAKIALHQQLLQLKTQQTFNLTWARLFYSYGEGQAASSLLPLIQAAVAKGERTFAMSGGEQLRDYLPIAAVADYLVQLALKDADPGTVNICSGEPISIRRLVEEQKALHGWDIEFDFGQYPYPDYEPMEFWGDAGKLNEITCR
jgi:nucleoside-diphosphate-sugar epimerase